MFFSAHGIYFFILIIILSGVIGGLINYHDPDAKSLESGLRGHLIAGVSGSLVLTAVAIYIFKMDYSIFNECWGFCGAEKTKVELVPAIIYFPTVGIIGGYSGLRLIPVLSRVTMDKILEQLEDNKKEIEKITIEDIYLKALFLETVKNWEEEIELLNIILEKEPSHDKAWLHKAYALKRLDPPRINESIKAISKSIELKPNKWLYWYNLACYKTLIGVEFTEIKPILEKCIDLTDTISRETLIKNLKIDVAPSGDFDILRNNDDYKALIDDLGLLEYIGETT